MNPKVDNIVDLWMNDEVLFEVSSDRGAFTLSRDIWDFVFIMADDNQDCIILIDEILRQSDSFLKEDVDFKKYSSFNGS